MKQNELESFLKSTLEDINTAVLAPQENKHTFDDIAIALNAVEASSIQTLKVVKYLRTVMADRVHFAQAMSIKPSELIEAIETMNSKADNKSIGLANAKAESEKEALHMALRDQANASR